MQYDGLPKITVPGYEESFCHREFNHANRNAFVISKSCKNVEAALRFYDYISEPTRAIEVFLGEQGIFWDYVDDDYHYEMVYCPARKPILRAMPRMYRSSSTLATATMWKRASSWMAPA